MHLFVDPTKELTTPPNSLPIKEKTPNSPANLERLNIHSFPSHKVNSLVQNKL